MRYLLLFVFILLFPPFVFVITSLIRAYRQNPDELKFYSLALTLAFGYGIWFRIKPIVDWTKAKWKKVTHT